jgi:hypothetical protein
MAFLDRYNTDDVHLRAVLVGLIDLLNKNVVIEHVISDTESKRTPVPFYPAMGNDERFMQDFYMYYSKDCDTEYAEGNYDPIPRGVVQLSTFTIDSASLTNKFVRGTFNRQEDGQVKAYSDYVNVIPMRITYDVQIIAGSLLEAFKIVQEFIATFYKAATFQVSYKGFKVPCQVGFAQDYTIERPTEFTYGDDKKITVTFPIEMETYQPVVGDPFSMRAKKASSTEMFRGNTMHRGIGNIITEVSGVSGVFATFSVDTDPSMSEDITDDPTPPEPIPPQIEP